MTTAETLRLFAGTRLIGVLEPDDTDYPRLYARFAETAAFNEFRELFRRQNDSPSVAICEQLDALDLRIVDPDGHEDRLFTIVIEGERAMLRPGFYRANKVADHDAFWRVLGDEVGPQKCREPDCPRLKITQSLFCKRHHFRMIRGEDYQGSLDDA